LTVAAKISIGVGTALASPSKLDAFHEKECISGLAATHKVTCGIQEKAEFVQLMAASSPYPAVMWSSLSNEIREIIVEDLYYTIFPHAVYWRKAGVNPLATGSGQNVGGCKESGMVPTPLFNAMNDDNFTWRSGGPLAKAVGQEKFGSGRFHWAPQGPINATIWEALIQETADMQVVDPNHDGARLGQFTSIRAPRNYANHTYREYPYLAFLLSHSDRAQQIQSLWAVLTEYFLVVDAVPADHRFLNSSPILDISGGTIGCTDRDLLAPGQGRLFKFSQEFLEKILWMLDQNNSPFGGLRCGCFPGKDWW
jgi:hypothetical protein